MVRLFVAAVVLLAGSVARADMVEIATSCPPGQAHLELPGCPGHGGISPCGPMPCTADAACGAGFRCAPRARCMEDTELDCVGGDGRMPFEERPTFTVHRAVDRGPCGDADACPGAATCSHVGECESLPVAPAAASVPAPAPSPPASAGCAATGRGTPSAIAVLAVAAWVRRRLSASARAPSRDPRG